MLRFFCEKPAGQVGENHHYSICIPYCFLCSFPNLSLNDIFHIDSLLSNREWRVITGRNILLPAVAEHFGPDQKVLDMAFITI
jgi:hypothetical protein